VGNPESEGTLPSYLTHLNLRHLGRPVTDSSMSLAPLAPLESQDSPLFIPLSTCNSCFANTFETDPYRGEKEGALRPIRYNHPLPLRHFAACRSRSAHNKSSCLGRHDLTARQKRAHRRIPQRKSGVRRSPYRCSQNEDRTFERMFHE
jgi:hypothetical protein